MRMRLRQRWSEERDRSDRQTLKMQDGVPDIRPLAGRLGGSGLARATRQLQGFSAIRWSVLRNSERQRQKRAVGAARADQRQAERTAVEAGERQRDLRQTGKPRNAKD